MDLTMCHLIGLAALYGGIEAIRKKSVIISIVVGSHTELQDTDENDGLTGYNYWSCIN